MQIPPTRIRVLVAHDSPVVAAGLVAALKTGAGLDVEDAQEEPDGSAGMQSEGEASDVVVVDYPRGLRWLRSSLGNRPAGDRAPPRVVVVSASDKEADVRLAIASGVQGFLLTDCDIEELIRSVRVVASGGRYLCSSAATRMADSLCQEAMTPRESDVMALLMKGLSNKMVARELGIAVGTAKAHVKAILGKLGVATRMQAVALATRRGLVPGDLTGGPASVRRTSAGSLALPRERDRRPRQWPVLAGSSARAGLEERRA
jgi:DNA-binding NarL/FixJ family response regulator